MVHHRKQSIDTSTRSTEESLFSLQSDDDVLSTNRSQSFRTSGVGNNIVRSQRQAGKPSLSAIAPHKRKSNDLSELTVDKLRFDSLELHGRDEEKVQLMQDFEALIAQDKSAMQRRLFLISGKSGTGKTKLAETLKEPASRKHGLFVKGKFDLNLRNQPYSGISNACAEICGAILMLQNQAPTRAKAICDDIEQSLNSELCLLVQTIPVLAEIVDLSDLAKDQGSDSNAASLSTYDSKNRINFAFVRLFRVFAKHFFPLIFVLDDLQWADASSFDLLEVLMSDHQVHKFMLIGIYRSNEVDETHIFHRYLQEFENKSRGKEFTMTQVQIHDLGINAVNTIIQDILGCDDPRTRRLAVVCFKKTHGNPFYLIHYLSMLHENQLLQYNFGTLSWTWDNDEIETSTRASDNVVDLLQHRMMELPDHMLDILKIAACLGSTFEQRLLQLVWSKFFFKGTKQDPRFVESFVAGIEELVKDELFVKVSETPPRIGWVHDKIHEAGIALVPPSDRKVYHGRVGEILAVELTDDELDASIFVIVDLLNGSLSMEDSRDDDARLEFARLNLKACQKAVRLSAFESAAQYAGQGILMLPQKAWEDDYELCLMLYSIGAKAEGFIGNVPMMETYCQAVLAQEHKPIEDKFDVFHTLIDNLTNRCKIDEAAKLLLEILGKFKCRFPKNPARIGLGVVNNVVRIQKTMKSRDTSQLASLNDNTRVHLMQLLDKLSTCFYMINDDRLPLVIFRSLNWTIQYGNCAYSAPAFATTGMILTGALNDIQGGSIYGHHALTLLNKMQSHSSAARTMFCVYSFLFPWTQQARIVLKPLLQAYDLGLRTGDAESAIWSIFHWLVIKFIIGSPLESLEADLQLYLKQMQDLKRDQAIKITKTLRQTILNLMGENESDHDPTQFFGQSLTESEFQMSHDETFWRAGVCLYHGVLLTYFGEHIRHAESFVAEGHGYLAKAHLACPNNMLDTYLKGISCYAAAQQTGLRKYAKLAKICRNKIKKWVQMGNPNVKHYETFLDAEALVLQGKAMAAVKQYEMTILHSARSGYQQDAALASERLGELQLLIMKDHDESAYRMREAEKYWRSWGAMGKVQHLEQKYPQFFFGKEPLGDVIVLAPSDTSTDI